MNSDEIVTKAINALEAANISYLLVGSLSCNQYAVARSTHDADFVIVHQPGVLADLMHRLGPGFRLDSQIRLETITGTMRNVITVAGSQFSIELFRLSDDPHDQARFQRRVRGIHMSHPVWIPTAEDVVVWKLRWATIRGKDRDDVREILSMQAGRLDWDYIRQWTDRHETRRLLEEILASIPPDLLLESE